MCTCMHRNAQERERETEKERERERERTTVNETTQNTGKIEKQLNILKISTSRQPCPEAEIVLRHGFGFSLSFP